MKKAFAFILVLSLLVSMMSATTIDTVAVPEDTPAQTCTDAQGVTYELSEDGTYYTVTAFDYSVYTLEIPAEISGIPVAALGHSCFIYSQLDSIKLPDTLKVIGKYAFCFSDYLTEIDIPDSVEEIGGSAFYMCSELAAINIPASVTKVGDRPFGGCVALNTITVDDANPVYYDENNCLIEIETKRLVSGCMDCEIPDGVVTIAYGAFSNFRGLTSIVLPDSVTTLENNAFWSCKTLESVTLSKSLSSMLSPFGGCSALHDVKIPVENTKFKFIDDCLIEVETKTLISAFSNAIIPIDGSVETIGREAFAGLENLKAVMIPDKVKTIGDSAFLLCENLESVQIGNGVTRINLYAFKDCKGLKSIKIPQGVTVMGSEAFTGCLSLATINCGATSMPAGWSQSWLGDCKATVVWAKPADPDPSTSSEDPSEPSTPSDDPSEPSTPSDDPSDPSIPSEDPSNPPEDPSVPDDDPAEPQAMKGDVNGNEEIDSMDYVFLKRAYFGTYKLKDDTVGDINGNEEIDSMDYVFLKRAYFGTYVIAE